MLVNYNLEPCNAMSKENIILTLLIPGPTQPGNDIDVYLQPLIDDLQDLWINGLPVKDSRTGEIFSLRAMLMWTINDFPAYGKLFGCCTHGKYNCPLCGYDNHFVRLPHCSKHVILGHRRFLDMDHSFKRNKYDFDGKTENREPPMIWDGRRVLAGMQSLENSYGKDPKGKRRRTDNEHELFRKKSIFFELPYWMVRPSKIIPAS